MNTVKIYGQGRDNSAILGKMVWLLSLSSVHREYQLQSIHQWLIPALEFGQYRIYHKDHKPVGFVTWSRMSKQHEDMYVRNPNRFCKEMWNSGERLWALDFVAPFGEAKDIVRDLRNNIFPNEIGRFLRVKPNSVELKVKYVHGINAVTKSQDCALNTPVLNGLRGIKV